MGIELVDSRNYTAKIESKSGALRVTPRALDIGVLGSYRKVMRSGTIAAGAGTIIAFSARWAPTPNTELALIRRIWCSMGNVTAFAAGFLSVDLFMARTQTVLHNSGGTAGTFTGNNGKLRTDDATSAGMSCYISTTGAISGGTEVLDTDAFASVGGSVTAVAGQSPIPPNTELFRAAPGERPIILENNEGFTGKILVPATGTYNLTLGWDWDEVDPTVWEN